VVFILLHETSHAVFDLLKVPILGREEDAADSLAAFLLLRAGEGIARRVLSGAAYMYLHDSKGRMPDDSDFSDVHGLDSQRSTTSSAWRTEQSRIVKGWWRRDTCPRTARKAASTKYRQVSYAVKEAIDPAWTPSVGADPQGGAQARWEVPRRRKQRNASK